MYSLIFLSSFVRIWWNLLYSTFTWALLYRNSIHSIYKDIYIIDMYEAYSQLSTVSLLKTSKLSYKILLISDSTFFKLFSHIFVAIIEELTLAGHKFLYTLLIECGRLRC